MQIDNYLEAIETASENRLSFSYEIRLPFITKIKYHFVGNVFSGIQIKYLGNIECRDFPGLRKYKILLLTGIENNYQVYVRNYSDSLFNGIWKLCFYNSKDIY